MTKNSQDRMIRGDVKDTLVSCLIVNKSWLLGSFCESTSKPNAVAQMTSSVSDEQTLP